MIKNIVKAGPPLDPRMTNMHSEKNTGDPLTCDVPLSWHLHVKISSFDTTQILLANLSSVIPVQTCVFDAQKNSLIGTARQFFWVPKISAC